MKIKKKKKEVTTKKIKRKEKKSEGGNVMLFNIYLLCYVIYHVICVNTYHEHFLCP